jgi:hypothetical protein
MEKNNTTTYITAKKIIGCRAPIVADFLVIIIPGFLAFKKWISILIGYNTYILYCRNKNIG